MYMEDISSQDGVHSGGEFVSEGQETILCFHKQLLGREYCERLGNRSILWLIVFQLLFESIIVTAV